MEAFFAACDSDGDKGMTLVEGNACEYDDLPSMGWFNYADTNGDGTATMKEWSEKNGCGENTPKKKH